MEEEKERLSSHPLSGLLMYILMSSSVASLGVQSPWCAAEMWVPLFHPFWKAFRLQCQLAFTAVLLSPGPSSLSL